MAFLRSFVRASFAVLGVTSCASSPPASSPMTAAAKSAPSVVSHRLPDAHGTVRLDYLALDRTRTPERLWIPAADTGDVDVFDRGGDKVRAVAELVTAARTTDNGARIVGPSSAAIVDGVAWIGNRADSRVCGLAGDDGHPINCVALPSSPDGLVAVPSRHEVWVTAPDVHKLIVLDVHMSTAPTVARSVLLDGEPEGYAVDEASGHLFTNLEDADRTLVVDLASGNVVSTFEPSCGKAGPRGVAFDKAGNTLIVACTDHLVTLDAASGKMLGTLALGGGVDNIDFVPSKRLVFAASGKDGSLTVARLAVGGSLVKVANVPMSKSTRVVVASADGTAYVADPMGGRIFVVSPPTGGW